MILINDVHVGFDRKGGTTPKSREKLRDFLFGGLKSLVRTAVDEGHETLVIVGDLFDQFEVDPRDWVETFMILQNWCSFGRELTLVAGNHDHSPKALRVSSFEALCKVLQSTYERVQVIAIDEWAYINDNVVALAHCSNQDIFNLRLEELLAKMGKGSHLLLHANYDNNFAVDSDHSLNVSADVARRFGEIGVKLYFAHEHQARTARGAQVVVFGNQWPTSVADCLNNDDKFAHVLHDDGTLQKIPTWIRDQTVGGFREIDWRELTESNADFIRVTGTATSAEASDVINTIAKFRQTSEAFVITNTVKVEGIADINALPESFEAAKTFDVMEFIAQHLSAEQMEVVRGLAA